MSSQRKVLVSTNYQNTITFDNWGRSGNNIFNVNSGNVGIATPIPESLFDVCGQTLISTPLVKIGIEAGASNQKSDAIAIGFQAGMINQDLSAISIGYQAGMCNQGFNAVALGYQAGMLNQGVNAVAVGNQAGMSNQGANAVAVGDSAGMCNQSPGAVAVGADAGKINQASNSVAFGCQAGIINPDISAIAIGYQAGMTNQGASSICIGAFSSSTFSNSIVLNATGLPLVADSSNALFIKPLDISTGFSNFIVYDTTSGKVSYNTKSAKTFVIDNPIHNDKYLVHSCLEGPEAGVYYRGEGEITNNKCVEIQLPFILKYLQILQHTSHLLIKMLNCMLQMFKIVHLKFMEKIVSFIGMYLQPEKL